MLIVGQPDTQRTRDQLAEELELMGFSVSTLPGDEEVAEDALDRSDLAAVVFLSDEANGVRVWVLESDIEDRGDVPEAVELEVAQNGSRETFALRTAELLRGRLMPTRRADPAEATSGERHEASGPGDTRFFVSIGPALVATSYSSVLLALSGDAAWTIAPRLMLGPFILASLERGTWNGDPKRYSVRQIEGSAKLRFALVEPGSKLHLHLLGRAGLRSLSLRTESGPPADRTTGSLSGPTFGLGAEGGYELSSWLSLGADMTFVAGFPVWDSFTTNPDLSPGQQRQADAAHPGPGPDFQWVTSVLLSARW